MDENRKIQRKRKRFEARLKSSKGVTCTAIPEPNIVLCNVGQATGLEKQVIYQLIQDSSLDLPLPKFIAEKGESYSFLVFKNTQDALVFYNTFNTKGKVDGTSLYMCFVESVPDNEIICHIENPSGLHLLEDFISSNEEQELIRLFDWIEDTESGSLKNRQVKHYGYEFRYGSNDVDLSAPLLDKIPGACEILWKRLEEQGYDFGEPDQLTVNKYEPGQGIPSHVDKHSPFRETILSLSLGSSLVMDWKHHTGKYVPVVVQARSMLIMSGEARYDWQHGIQPKTYDPIIETRVLTTEDTQKSIKVITSDTVPRQTRISLTFRWTRSGPCDCVYGTLCDSVHRQKGEIEDGVASMLEDLHVHQVYEQIAGHFSSTRHTPWPRVLQFARRAAGVLLDLGAGNGKNILPRDDILQIAGERSSGLLSECKDHIQSIPTADCIRLDLLHPGLRDACADVVMCIAVIHHFSSRSRRLQAIESISRLLRPGGSALITVWAKDQTSSNYLCKNKHQESKQEHVSTVGVTLPIHENRTQFKYNDLLVPWKLRSKTNEVSDQQSTLLRYYHVFEESELEELCLEVNGLVVESSFYEEGNWCVICNKV